MSVFAAPVVAQDEPRPRSVLVLAPRHVGFEMARQTVAISGFWIMPSTTADPQPPPPGYPGFACFVLVTPAEPLKVF